MGGTVDEMQRCMNLMEALEDVSRDVKNYRTHCADICSVIRSLSPLVLSTQQTLPNLLLEHQEARDAFHKLNTLIEEAVLAMRSLSNLTTLDKLMNQGEPKKRLQNILEGVQMVSREVECYLQHHNKKRLAQQASPPTPNKQSLQEPCTEAAHPLPACQDEPLPDLITFESSNPFA